MNIDQPVTDYAWLKSIPQIAADQFPRLPDPVTLASVCQGTAALANIQIMQTGRVEPTPLEVATSRSLLDGLSTTRYVSTGADVRLPYDALLQLTAPRNRAGKSLRSDYTAWNQLATWVVQQQNTTGEWGGEHGTVMMPSTSLLALRTVLKNITDADIVKMYDKPHLTPSFFFSGNDFRYTASEAPYFTAAALLFLADGLPAPATATAR